MVAKNEAEEETCKKNVLTEDVVSEEPSKFASFCIRHGINPNLVTLKLCLFFLYGATSSLLPYLTIHMQAIGLTVQEIAMIYLALPFTTFLAPPLTGFLVDKFGKYKPIVITSLLLNALIHHSLLIIPHQELPGVMPAAYVLRNNVTEVVEVWWSPCPSRECPEEEELDMVLDKCVDYCLLSQSTPSPETVANQSKVESPANAPTSPASVDNLPDLGDKDDLILRLGKKKTKPQKSATFFVVDMHPNLAEPPEQLGIEMQQDENDTVTGITDRFAEDYLRNSDINVTALQKLDLRCGGVVLATNLTYKHRLEELAANCILQKCRFRAGGPDICPPDYNESDELMFWLYFVLRFLGQIALSASVTIMDPIALTMIQKYNGDFGKERLFSSIGMAIFSPITGFFIDMYSKELGHSDYSPAFFTYDILLIASALTVLIMPLGDKLPADNVFQDLLNILKMAHVMIFIIFLFILGNFWGFIESFLFLYLKELGAPNYMLGITVTVGTLSSMPFLYGADKLTKKFGHVNIIVIAFFSHAARLVGYSFIESAWWCFPFEALESLSVHLMWVAAATYCAILAPKTLLASLIGILGMSHFSIGRGSGSFVGGILIENVGTREAFRYMGLMAVAGGIGYAILHFAWLRKVEAHNDFKDEEEQEPDEIEKLNATEAGTETPNKSAERLSLIIEYNQIGSLSSLRRSFNEHVPRRRSSYNIDSGKGSSSKVDRLKIALEKNTSNPQIRISNGSLSRNKSIYLKVSNDNLDARAISAPKLNNKSIPQLSTLDEARVRTNSIKETIEESDEKLRNT